MSLQPGRQTGLQSGRQTGLQSDRQTAGRAGLSAGGATRERLASPYQGYLYAYPHKSAYRPLDPAPALRDVWAGERLDALFGYVHLPFCEMRCGFCNLFTRAGPPPEQVQDYVKQVRVQAVRTRRALHRAAGGGPVSFARAALGGGTPTYLDAGQLATVFDLLEEELGIVTGPGAVPLSVETSPATATPDRLAVLVERGTTRISLGVQSFLDDEARAAGRSQRRADVERALATIRTAGTPVLNLDLIYGIPGQTAGSWARSLDAALAWAPEELYLYPLYVRPLTGLRHRVDGADPAWDAQRLALYRQGRDTLIAHGYRQESMRLFRRVNVPAGEGPQYCCQDDGMVGLGCGARSYTSRLHYSFDYAVGVGAVRGILADYLRSPAEDFDHAPVGYRLDGAEQRRRWLLKSLLRADGVRVTTYRQRFGAEPAEDFPQLLDLVAAGYAVSGAGVLRLTAAGLERSDAIGPWLVSDQVRSAMRAYRLR